MTIRSEQINDDSMALYLSGRLDTTSSPAFELKINELIDGTIDIIFDLKDLSYISSSGLHVLILTHKLMNANGKKLIIRNITGSVKDVFDMTGFSSIITME